jgi:hypothetical protein
MAGDAVFFEQGLALIRDREGIAIKMRKAATRYLERFITVTTGLVKRMRSSIFQFQLHISARLIYRVIVGSAFSRRASIASLQIKQYILTRLDAPWGALYSDS